MASKTYYYKKTRGSVVDVICDELTFGEEVYLKNESTGKYTPTRAASLLIDEYNVSTCWNEDGTNYILVLVGSEDMQGKVVEVAKKFGKEYHTSFSKYFSKDKAYQVKIYIDEEDFDNVYFDPNVLIRSRKES